MKNVVTIPQQVTKGEELVVIPRSLYEKFSWIEGEIEDVLGKVRRGRKALKDGKTHIVDSPRELLKKKKK
jgi:hypothetical protein